jgi:hypothetical protein
MLWVARERQQVKGNVRTNRIQCHGKSLQKDWEWSQMLLFPQIKPRKIRFDIPLLKT